MNSPELKAKFRKYEVTDVHSIAEFLEKYYKPTRYHKRGSDYAAAILASHQRDLDKYGYDFISHHDSVTGEIVSFFRPEPKAPKTQLTLFET